MVFDLRSTRGTAHDLRGAVQAIELAAFPRGAAPSWFKMFDTFAAMAFARFLGNRTVSNSAELKLFYSASALRPDKFLPLRFRCGWRRKKSHRFFVNVSSWERSSKFWSKGTALTGTQCQYPEDCNHPSSFIFLRQAMCFPLPKRAPLAEPAACLCFFILSPGSMPRITRWVSASSFE